VGVERPAWGQRARLHGGEPAILNRGAAVATGDVFGLWHSVHPLFLMTWRSCSPMGQPLGFDVVAGAEIVRG
jgi:hypothetical protein